MAFLGVSFECRSAKPSQRLLEWGSALHRGRGPTVRLHSWLVQVVVAPMNWGAPTTRSSERSEHLRADLLGASRLTYDSRRDARGRRTNLSSRRAVGCTVCPSCCAAPPLRGRPTRGLAGTIPSTRQATVLFNLKQLLCPFVAFESDLSEVAYQLAVRCWPA